MPSIYLANNSESARRVEISCEERRCDQMLRLLLREYSFLKDKNGLCVTISGIWSCIFWELVHGDEHRRIGLHHQERIHVRRGALVE